MEKACEQNRFKNKQDGKPDMVRAPHMPAYPCMLVSHGCQWQHDANSSLDSSETA